MMGLETHKVKLVFLLIAFFAVIAHVSAQVRMQSEGMIRRKGPKNDKILESLELDKLPWYDGSIMLADGNEIKGMVKYNERSGVLHYQDDQDLKALLPRRVAAFEFFDTTAHRQRVFYSLPEKIDSTENHYFFEAIRQFKSFALLLKIDPLEVESKATVYRVVTTVAQGAIPVSQIMFIKERETFYLMSDRGELWPFVRFAEVDKDRLLLDTEKSKNEILDKGALQQLTRENYTKLKEFADKNGLSFRRRGDLLEIFDYYQTLEE